MSAERSAELRAMLVAASGPDPADTEPLELGDLEHWPVLSWGSMADYLPESVARAFGTRVATMLSSGLRIERAVASEVIGALRQAGIHCKYDARLNELFSAWD